MFIIARRVDKFITYITIKIIQLITNFVIKLNIKTNLLDEYVNSVDITMKQNETSKVFIVLIVVILCLFLVFVLFKYNTK